MKRLPLLALALSGCVSPQWRGLALQCGERMDKCTEVLTIGGDALDRCAKHMTIYHGGAKLTRDGGLTEAPEGLRGRE